MISADGKEQLLQFDKDNSPLPGNTVRSIAVNERTGEVFFGTEKGMVSYQSDAVAGRRINSPNPLVFPNPVHPDYDGPITVRGFSTNAIVKITDANGKLVYETQALGGQAVWDGRDYNGRKVQTGVYLVFSSTNPQEGNVANPDGAVAKILFIN
ncbi:MAG: FlgD immunoglobulin-like domain containing protein [Saprospiraceae bacterium]